MKKNKVIGLLKEKNIVIPLYIYKLYPKLNIDLETFLFLMYLYSFGDKIIFDAHRLSDEFGTTLENILSYIDKLSTNKLVNFEIIKNDKGISEEYISLEYFYEKISFLLIEDDTSSIDSDSRTVFEFIEKEFGRVLSPIEYEIIKAWKENNINNELIEEAVKESVFKGVTNLRYVDKILYEWQKKGFKNREDVEENKKKFRKEKPEKMEVFEYNWLEDDE